MGEENKVRSSGFRIKWADREVECYGEFAQQNFDKVFELLKSTPTINPLTISEQPTSGEKAHQIASAASNQEYDRISKDAKVSKEQAIEVIRFEKRDEFEGLVPLLPAHPPTRDAVRLIVYSVQVGLQKAPIEISFLKNLLVKVNGYPLPGGELGSILKDFRRDNVTITSQTQGRNMPISLSTKGLDQARQLVKKEK
jgi:hypothetical protein